jgi:hypothetical protein
VFFGPSNHADRGNDAYEPVYRSSRYCSACHEGTVLGVHVYSTYSEWLASPAARQRRQCQDCHDAHGDSAGDESHINSRLIRALAVTADVRSDADGVHCTIDLRANNVGHCLPTGFIDRHLILTIEATDQEDKPLAAQSGPILPEAAGDLAGRPGRLFARLLTDEQGHAPIPFWQATAPPLDSRLQQPA